MNIQVGDTVYHQLSKLLFRCENNKQMRWMNMNPFYERTLLKEIDYELWEGMLAGLPFFNKQAPNR